MDDSALVACVLDVRLARMARMGEPIGELVQRAYSVFNGHIRILGCTEIENRCIHLSHLLDSDGWER